MPVDGKKRCFSLGKAQNSLNLASKCSEFSADYGRLLLKIGKYQKIGETCSFLGLFSEFGPTRPRCLRQLARGYSKLEKGSTVFLKA